MTLKLLNFVVPKEQTETRLKRHNVLYFCQRKHRMETLAATGRRRRTHWGLTPSVPGLVRKKSKYGKVHGSAWECGQEWTVALEGRRERERARRQQVRQCMIMQVMAVHAGERWWRSGGAPNQVPLFLGMAGTPRTPGVACRRASARCGAWHT